jgi:hypothetical protein
MVHLALETLKKFRKAGGSGDNFNRQATDVVALLNLIAWLVDKSILNWGSEPLLIPKSGIVKIYGPPVYGAVRFNIKTH